MIPSPKTLLPLFLLGAFSVTTSLGFALKAPEIRRANIATDLADIQDCRKSAYAGKTNLLTAAVSFCNADQAQRDGFICIIAREKNRVIGTADLNTKSGVVNNVYVREEERKRGIGRDMMVAVEEALGKGSKLKLTVYSNNEAAVALYRGMGFETPGVYGGLAAFSSATNFNFLLEMEKSLN